METKVIIVVIAICVGCLAEEKCSNLDKVKNDDGLTVEPYDKTWWLVKSYIRNPCVNFQYISNVDGETEQALYLFVSREGNWTVPAKVVVNPEMDMWNATQARGINTVYRKLFFDNKNHIWCQYSCDETDDKINVFLCFARNAKGRDLVNEKLNTTYADLPWKSNATLFDSFPDSCLDLYKKPEDY